ncbi:MAG TPA: hypothetical protein VFS17_08960 [Methylophilaceae bacterium]|nr:hypothetical protein [Methylophilaceae bacterium]
MKIDTLKNCITTLQDIRDVYDGQLDASVVLKLDEIISELKSYEKCKSEVQMFDLSTKALHVIADVLSVISNITDWM